MIKTSTAPYAALLLRVSLGIMFLAHVGLKIFVFTIPGFVGYFGSLGLPAALAYAVVALELFGGLALILGIYAPLSRCRWHWKCWARLRSCTVLMAGCSPTRAAAGNTQRSGRSA